MIGGTSQVSHDGFQFGEATGRVDWSSQAA